MKGVDCVLIHPNARGTSYGPLAKFAAVEPPLWALMLAGFLRDRGHEVAVVDAEARDLGPLSLAIEVEGMKPALAVVVAYGHQPSASTQTMTAVEEAVRAIRLTGAARRVAVVGGHASALPQRTLRDTGADYVCTGEGFHALDWALREFDRGRDPELNLLEGSNLVDLEQALPAYDLLPADRGFLADYRAHNWHALGTTPGPYASVYTSLGCPYECSFCCIQAPFQRADGGEHTYRTFTPAAVVKTILSLWERGVRNIKVADEMFVLKPQHVMAICWGIIASGVRDLNLWAYARVDTVRDDLLPLLREAGFRWLALGIESASEHVRRDSLKTYGHHTAKQTVQKIRDAGIAVIANYIFGLPEDDLLSMRATLDLALDLRSEWANFYCAAAYPGSRLYEEAVREKWPLPDRWADYAQHSPRFVPLPTRHATGQEVLEFRDYAHAAYFSDAGYLERVQKTFGREARERVEEMNAVKIGRTR